MSHPVTLALQISVFFFHIKKQVTVCKLSNIQEIEKNNNYGNLIAALH